VAEKLKSLYNFEEGDPELVRFCKGFALTPRFVKRCNGDTYCLCVVLLQLNVKFETVIWNNTTCDTVENYHVDGGSVPSQSPLTH
jgi:hypothetical protein